MNFNLQALFIKKKDLFYLFLVRWACVSLCVGVCICGSSDSGVQKRLFDTLELE